MKNLPTLDQVEKLELENIMLRMALESEKMNKYEMMHAEAKRTLEAYQVKLEAWNKTFETKLQPLGLKITDIGIDAETGKVQLLRPQPDQPQKVD